jgi:SAM-dependent methyltransferase
MTATEGIKGREGTLSSSPYEFKGSPYSSHSRLLEAFAGQGAGRAVIDVGDGEGLLSRPLLERGYRVACVALPGSVSATMPAGVEVVEADLNRELPALERDLSFALCGDVLEHLVDPEETLRWLGAALAPDGRLVASLPNSAHWFVRLNVLLGRFPEDDKGLFDRTHLHFYAWSNWKALLERSGFVAERVTPTVIPFELALPRLGQGWIVRALEAVNFALARVWRDLWAYQLVVVARKTAEPESLPGR